MAYGHEGDGRPVEADEVERSDAEVVGVPVETPADMAPSTDEADSHADDLAGGDAADEQDTAVDSGADGDDEFSEFDEPDEDNISQFPHSESTSDREDVQNADASDEESADDSDDATGRADEPEATDETASSDETADETAADEAGDDASGEGSEQPASGDDKQEASEQTQDMPAAGQLAVRGTRRALPFVSRRWWSNRRQAAAQRAEEAAAEGRARAEQDAIYQGDLAYANQEGAYHQSVTLNALGQLRQERAARIAAGEQVPEITKAQIEDRVKQIKDAHKEAARLAIVRAAEEHAKAADLQRAAQLEARVNGEGYPKLDELYAATKRAHDHVKHLGEERAAAELAVASGTATIWHITREALPVAEQSAVDAKDEYETARAAYAALWNEAQQLRAKYAEKPAEEAATAEPANA